MESKCSLFMPWSKRMQMLGCQWLSQKQLRHPNPWTTGLATLMWLQRPEERLPTWPRLREGWWWSPTVMGPVRVCMAWWSPVCCELQLFAHHILWELACLYRWLKDSFHGGYSPFIFFRSVFKKTWPSVSNLFYYVRLSDLYVVSASVFYWSINFH